MISIGKQNAMMNYAALSVEDLGLKKLGAHEWVQHINDLSDADARGLADELLEWPPEVLQDLLPHCLPSCSSKVATMTLCVLLCELSK